MSIWPQSTIVADTRSGPSFQVDISQIETGITAQNHGATGGLAKRADTPGADFALLSVPLVPSKTDVVARTILLAFQNVPFASLDDNLFSTFLLETTLGSSMTLGLHGLANSRLRSFCLSRMTNPLTRRSTLAAQP